MLSDFKCTCLLSLCNLGKHLGKKTSDDHQIAFDVLEQCLQPHILKNSVIRLKQCI